MAFSEENLVQLTDQLEKAFSGLLASIADLRAPVEALVAVAAKATRAAEELPPGSPQQDVVEETRNVVVSAAEAVSKVAEAAAKAAQDATESVKNAAQSMEE